MFTSYLVVVRLPSHYFPSVSDRWFGGVGGGFLIPLKRPSQPYKSLALLSQDCH